MNPIETLKVIIKEIESNKDEYVANSQKDFTRKCKVTFYDVVPALHRSKEHE